MTHDMQNRITQLFKIEYPIIQAGMVWTSGWRLASAVSNSGGLGLIGSGSMTCEILKEHIQKCKAATGKPFGVNVPLLYPAIEKQMQIIVDEKVPIVFTSAGNPSAWTKQLKQHNITVVHVVSSSRFAKKAEDAGCDAVVAEGFEAGGHNGREETTTMVLVPLVCDSVKIPVIAAGGIATGRQMLAAMVLGEEGVQIGSRFVASEEASCHIRIANFPLPAYSGDTCFTLLFDQALTPLLRSFRPGLIIVSAGFDAYWTDPLTSLGLSTSGYHSISKKLVDLAQEICGGKIVFVLEGGYDSQNVSNGVRAVFGAMTGIEPPPVNDLSRLPEPDISGRVDVFRK